MNRSRTIFLACSLVLLLPLVAGVVWSDVAAGRDRDGEDSLYKYLAIFSEVLGLVRHNYVDETDPSALLAGAMDGVSDALDPFSAWIPAEQVADYQRALALGRSRTGLTVLRDRGVAFVLSVEEGSPGAGAGFEAGDILTEVDGEPTRDLPAWRIADLLGREREGPVRARILRQGESEEIEMTAAAYAAPVPKVERVRGVPVLHLPTFDEATAEAVAPLLAELAGAGESRLLVDLRGVAGGSAEGAYGVARRLAHGELGRLGAAEAPRREFRSEGEPVWTGEIVVLVDGATQGPAEILAAALRERAGARLVGVETFGWAGERDWVELEGGGRLHLTSAFYTTPEGEPISSALAPDVLVDALARRFGDRERPLSELILERGLDLLLGETRPAEQAA